jgi:hypothetical protein
MPFDRRRGILRGAPISTGLLPSAISMLDPEVLLAFFDRLIERSNQDVIAYHILHDNSDGTERLPVDALTYPTSDVVVLITLIGEAHA